MTKREFVWVLIRLVGVCFAYLAAVTFFTTISAGWGVIFAPPKLDIANSNVNRSLAVPGIPSAPFDPSQDTTGEKPVDERLSPEEKARREAVTDLVWSLVLVLIYGGLGFYFLRDGRLLFLLLMREETADTKDAEPEVTTLNL